MKNSTLLHIPHASTWIPDEYLPLFTLSRGRLKDELLHMTDRYTDELFPGCYPSVKAPVSRLVCDMERFRLDEEEEMARIGMGVCYTRGCRLQQLKQISAGHRTEILRRYYDPHHEALTETVRRTLETCGRCLLVDCHSFASRPLPYEPIQHRERPEICLGTDPFHTPEALVRRAEALFTGMDFSVSVNTPYAGALVPMACYRRELRLQALMIEVNRNMYMNEETGEKTSGFERIRQVLARVVESLV